MFASNEILDGVVGRISGQEPDWDYLGGRISNSELFLKGSLEEEVGFMSWLAECHLVHLLSVDENAGGFMNVRPLKFGEENGGYYFRRRRERTFCYPEGQKTTCAEYDRIVVCEDLPVCFEVSLTAKKNKRKNPEQGSGQNPLSRLLREDNLAKRINPLQSYFDVDQIGYVVVVHPGMIDSASTSQQQFSALGGHLVPFYADRDKFVEDVAAFRQKYEL